jgi:hypothetical protein
MSDPDVLTAVLTGMYLYTDAADKLTSLEPEADGRRMRDYWHQMGASCRRIAEDAQEQDAVARLVSCNAHYLESGVNSLKMLGSHRVPVMGHTFHGCIPARSVMVTYHPEGGKVGEEARGVITAARMSVRPYLVIRHDDADVGFAQKTEPLERQETRIELIGDAFDGMIGRYEQDMRPEVRKGRHGTQLLSYDNVFMLDEEELSGLLWERFPRMFARTNKQELRDEAVGVGLNVIRRVCGWRGMNDDDILIAPLPSYGEPGEQAYWHLENAPALFREEYANSAPCGKSLSSF